MQFDGDFAMALEVQRRLLCSVISDESRWKSLFIFLGFLGWKRKMAAKRESEKWKN